jgi:hemerythrin-like domain-containing protein
MNNIEKSTQILREEHRLIECATLAFADIIKELQRGNALDRRRVWEITQSFNTYVGRWHHAKEGFLLSMVRARGGCSAEYPGRTFYEEHRHIRPLLGNLEGATHEYLQAAHGIPESLVRSLRDIVDFYPGHIWKADHLLFPLANELLSEVDQVVLLQQFDWIESVVDSDIDEHLRAIVAEFRPEPRTA